MAPTTVEAQWARSRRSASTSSTPQASSARSTRPVSRRSWTSASGGECAARSTPGPTRAASRRSWPTLASDTSTMELAPDTELRHLQYREDARQGVGKRSRVRLSPEYVRAYTEEILDLAPLEPFVRQLPVHGIGALLCVEATAEACHRSLVAERLAERFGFEVVHLEPHEPTDLELL